MRAWEGTIALLGTYTEDGRMIDFPEANWPHHPALPLPVVLIQDRAQGGNQPCGSVTHIGFRERSIWAEGWADERLSGILEARETVPCGVDMDYLLMTRMVFRKWYLRTLCVYPDGKSPFGDEVFIRLKE